MIFLKNWGIQAIRDYWAKTPKNHVHKPAAI